MVKCCEIGLIPSVSRCLPLVARAAQEAAADPSTVEGVRCGHRFVWAREFTVLLFFHARAVIFGLISRRAPLCGAVLSLAVVLIKSD